MKTNDNKEILISIISHNHNRLFIKLLSDLDRLNGEQRCNLHVVLTINVPEKAVNLSGFQNLQFTVIENLSPKGFGANNNQAFETGSSDFFLVINPDVRLEGLNFKKLISIMESDRSIGVLGPKVVSSSGNVEDSFRKFPTFFNISKRIFRKRLGVTIEKPNLNLENGQATVDWVAGMFMFFVSEDYAALGGFDERYFMYLEDADLCRRMHKSGKRIVYADNFTITHDAQRATLKNRKHLLWHVQSMIRFLTGKG